MGHISLSIVKIVVYIIVTLNFLRRICAKFPNHTLKIFVAIKNVTIIKIRCSFVLFNMKSDCTRKKLNLILHCLTIKYSKESFMTKFDCFSLFLFSFQSYISAFCWSGGIRKRRTWKWEFPKLWRIHDWHQYILFCMRVGHCRITLVSGFGKLKEWGWNEIFIIHIWSMRRAIRCSVEKLVKY